jgi:3-dehydroquinate dehydratase/shikimate dehydrogenase
MNFLRIESERLILREWNETDIEPFASLNCDPDVMQYFPKPLTTEESKQFIIKSNSILQEKSFGLWAAEIKSSSEFIGFIGLAVPTFEAPFTPCIEIGWRLAKKFWSQGYATEGARRVLQYAFDDLHLNEVVSFTSELNRPSIRVMERIGMKRDPNEDFYHPRVEKGHRLEKHVLYRLKKNDFPGNPS